jgi:hypothetical protein
MRRVSVIAAKACCIVGAERLGATYAAACAEFGAGTSYAPPDLNTFIRTNSIPFVAWPGANFGTSSKGILFQVRSGERTLEFT